MIKLLLGLIFFGVIGWAFSCCWDNLDEQIREGTHSDISEIGE